MQLRRLQGLNVEKLEAELADLLRRIAEYKAILADENKVKAIIRAELTEIAEKYGDERRTEISFDDNDINIEDLVADEDVVITISHAGYIKRMPMDAYRPQKRGGRGVSATRMKESDFVENIFITTTHHYIHFFTNKGRLLRLKAFEVPEGARTGRGTAMINLLKLEEGEKVTAVLPLRSYDDDAYLTCATRNGNVKKTRLIEYNTARKDGILAIRLQDGDELIAVHLTHGEDELIFVTAHGYAIRFSESDVRASGRVSMGVRGVRLDDGDRVVSMDVVRPEGELLVVSTNGYGKRTPIADYRCQSRGGKGIRTMALSPQTGDIAAAMMVRAGQELMVISTGGTLIRTTVDEIGVPGRATRGVRIMKMSEDDRVIDIARIAEEPAGGK